MSIYRCRYFCTSLGLPHTHTNTHSICRASEFHFICSKFAPLTYWNRFACGRASARERERVAVDLIRSQLSHMYPHTHTHWLLAPGSSMYTHEYIHRCASGPLVRTPFSVCYENSQARRCVCVCTYVFPLVCVGVWAAHICSHMYWQDGRSALAENPTNCARQPSLHLPASKTNLCECRAASKVPRGWALGG